MNITQRLSAHVGLLALTTSILLPNQANATDEIICNSEQFVASFAVGSSGYVSQLILANPSKKYLAEILETQNLKVRLVSIPTKSAHIKAKFGTNESRAVEIHLESGAGFIILDSHKEKMACDWSI